jgi:hypothetical protein
MSASPPQERFKERVIQFCDFFKNVLEEAIANKIDVPASPFIMDIVKNFIKKEDSDKAITTFILRSYKSWDRALNREKDYFRSDGLSAFAGIGKEHIDSFNSLFDVKKADGTLLIDDNIQEGLWQLFDSLIKTSICYVHQQREPCPTTKKYTKPFFPEIKIKSLVEAWQITSLE